MNEADDCITNCETDVQWYKVKMWNTNYIQDDLLEISVSKNKE